MGQLVSLLPICRPGNCEKVRVKSPCGRREEVYNSCVAEKVMVKHPEYLVVHCAFNNDVVDITVIAADQRLEPGVPYMLYPRVESLGSPGTEKSNIPASFCMSMKDREVKFPSSDSFKSKDTGSPRRSVSLPSRGSPKKNIEKVVSSPGQEVER